MISELGSALFETYGSIISHPFLVMKVSLSVFRSIYNDSPRLAITEYGVCGSFARKTKRSYKLESFSFVSTAELPREVRSRNRNGTRNCDCQSVV